MNRLRLMLVVVIVALVVQLGWYTLVWTQLLDRPELRGVDFISYYAVGRIAQSGDWKHIYDAERQRTEQEALDALHVDRGGVLPFLHPPFIVSVLWMLVGEDYRASYLRWSGFLLLLFVASAVVLHRILRGAGLRSHMATLSTIAAMLFYPLFVSVLQGQDTALLLLGSLLFILGLQLRRDAVAGLGLALTTIRPQVALLLALPFLLRCRGVWWWFCAGSTALVAASLALVGAHGVRDYVGLLASSSRGMYVLVNQSAMPNLTRMLLRRLPMVDSSLVQYVAWGGYLLAVVGLCLLWYRSPGGSEWPITGTGFIWAVFTAPHIHYHDVTLLLLPIAVWLIRGLEQRTLRQQFVPLILASISLVLQVTGLMPSDSRFVAVYVLMLGLGVALWATKRVVRSVGSSTPIS